MEQQFMERDLVEDGDGKRWTVIDATPYRVICRRWDSATGKFDECAPRVSELKLVKRVESYRRG